MRFTFITKHIILSVYDKCWRQNKTLIQPQGNRGMTSNATNIVLVHGAWADGSSWSKIIPILENAGHRVIAIQLPLHFLADDVATVKHAIDLVGGQ
jgi:pimeloyl-ACP methyl ester carboxylesterase